ncbi:hypothetical protein CELL_02602 [Cellulomonas sp. T2.31MG-18]|uniref:PulJ/GspJ family protein n=1 Tax=Cellulomonas sp. T2.31MG-18 TaxID=3157619 RepID=UPI0035EDC6A5
MRDAIRRCRRRTSEEGTTLVELLVAMIVFAIAMTMIMAAAIAVQKVTKDSEASADAVFQTRQALATIDKQVRSGNVLFSPADEATYLTTCQSYGTNAGSCMRIYTQTNGPQKCVQWQVSPDGTGTYQLLMRSWTPDWQTVGGVSGWAVTARGLAAPSAGSPPFTLDTNASGTYGTRLLRVHLDAINAKSGKDVALDASISGRNTTYGYTGNECLPVPAA